MRLRTFRFDKWPPAATACAFIALAVCACTSEPTPVRPTTTGLRTPLPSSTAMGVASPAPTTTAPPPSPTASGGIAVGAAAMTAPSVSSAVAVTADGAVVAVNPDSDSVTLVDARTLHVIAEVGVGDDPRTLAVTPDGAYALVANHGGDSVSAVDLAARREAARWPVGAMPYGVATDGARAYVAEFALGDVAVIDLASGVVERRLAVGEFPAGLGVTETGRLLVTHHFTGAVTAIDPASLAVGATVKPRVDANLAQSIAFAADGARAFLPVTRPNATNPTLLFDTTLFPVVSVFDVTTGAFLPSERITLDTADRPVSMPFAAAVTPDGSTLYVANAGSNDVSAIDLATGTALANVKVGANPRGIAVAPDGSRAFVNNVLDGTLSVIDTATNAVTATVPITHIPLPEAILLGKRLFNAAIEPKLTTDNWIACASCHFDGMTDNRTWLGFPDGPRNTPSLLGVAETAPFHWSGDLDELEDVELTVRKIQGGAGLVNGDAYDTLGPPHAGRSAELDALAAYMRTLQVRPSPVRREAAVVVRGQALFAELGCGACHVPPTYTDGQLHDVGTGDPAKERNSHGRGTRFDTPTLRGLWLTAPYLHDGTAPTLYDVFAAGTTHNALGRVSPEQLDALVTFLFTLP